MQPIRLDSTRIYRKASNFFFWFALWELKIMPSYMVLIIQRVYLYIYIDKCICVCVCFGFVLRAIIYRERKKHKSGCRKKEGKKVNKSSIDKFTGRAYFHVVFPPNHSTLPPACLRAVCVFVRGADFQ